MENIDFLGSRFDLNRNILFFFINQAIYYILR